MFYVSHPSFRIFVDNLKKVQANTYIRMRHLDKEALIRKGAARKLQSAVNARTDLETNLDTEPWSQNSRCHHKIV